MRFVSPYREYSITLRQEIKKPIDTAQGTYFDVVQPMLQADFRQEGIAIYPWEKEAALKHFRFSGMPEVGDNENQEDIKTWRVSVFDTEFDTKPEERELIEELLVTSPFNGQDFILVEQPPLAAPVQNYENLTVTSLIDVVKILDLDPDVVIAYERENDNRPDFIEALEELKTETVVEA